MKKIALGLSLTLVLSACGSEKAANDNSPAATPSNSISAMVAHYVVPKTCELPEVNAAFAKIVPPSKYIPTKWTPAAGTDLYEALNAGGIACSYGDQPAEVGGTVIWAPNVNGLWDSRVAQWEKEGLIKVDIPGVDETAAYKLPDGATSADGMPAWRVNLLIGDIWIQLGAAFIQSWDEATPIIQSAISVSK